MITFLGFPSALQLGAGIYVVAIAFMLVLPRSKPETWAGEQGLWRNLQEGLAYAASDRRVVGVLIVTVIFNVWVFPYTAMIWTWTHSTSACWPAWQVIHRLRKIVQQALRNLTWQVL